MSYFVTPGKRYILAAIEKQRKRGFRSQSLYSKVIHNLCHTKWAFRD